MDRASRACGSGCEWSMNSEADYERCLAFINCQLQSPHRGAAACESNTRMRAVTISRQAGCGALVVAQKLADHLESHFSKERSTWAVFDRNLVEKVLEDHNLPKRLAKFMAEDWISEMADTMDELFGLHPPSWLLVRQTAETIFHLAELGNVILIGRGGNIVTSKLDYVFHVRLVGSLEKRIEHIRAADHLERKEAVDFIQREDLGRKRYLKKYFKKDIDDPLLYHLVINTDLVPYDEAARIIADAMGHGEEIRYQKLEVRS
jgi:cytidylate kinase